MVPAEFRALPYAETVVAVPSGPGTRRGGTPPRLGVHLSAGGLLQQTVACACDPPPRRAASVRRPQVPPGRQDGLFLRYLRVHPLVQRPPAVEYRSRGRDDGSRRAVDRQEQADLRRQRQFGAAEPRQGPPFHLPAGRHSVPEEVGQGDFPAGDHAASPPRTFHAHVFRFGVLRCRHLDAPSRISPGVDQTPYFDVRPPELQVHSGDRGLRRGDEPQVDHVVELAA